MQKEIQQVLIISGVLLVTAMFFILMPWGITTI